MYLLLLGLAVFIGIHLLPSFPGLRRGLIGRFGEKTYKGIFAVIAVIGIIIIIIGKSHAPFVVVWEPPYWGRDASYLIMLFAFILVTAAYLPTNIRRFTRHPMLWGVVLWSIAHLLSKGDLAAITIFIAIGIFALFDMVSSNLRGAKLSTEKLSINKDLTVVLIGVATYFVVLTIHPAWSGFRMLR